MEISEHNLVILNVQVILLPTAFGRRFPSNFVLRWKFFTVEILS